MSLRSYYKEGAVSRCGEGVQLEATFATIFGLLDVEYSQAQASQVFLLEKCHYLTVNNQGLETRGFKE